MHQFTRKIRVDYWMLQWMDIWKTHFFCFSKSLLKWIMPYEYIKASVITACFIVLSLFVLRIFIALQKFLHFILIWPCINPGWPPPGHSSSNFSSRQKIRLCRVIRNTCKNYAPYGLAKKHCKKEVENGENFDETNTGPKSIKTYTVLITWPGGYHATSKYTKYGYKYRCCCRFIWWLLPTPSLFYINFRASQK